MSNKVTAAEVIDSRTIYRGSVEVILDKSAYVRPDLSGVGEVTVDGVRVRLRRSGGYSFDDGVEIDLDTASDLQWLAEALMRAHGEWTKRA